MNEHKKVSTLISITDSDKTHRCIRRKRQRWEMISNDTAVVQSSTYYCNQRRHNVQLPLKIMERQHMLQHIEGGVQTKARKRRIKCQSILVLATLIFVVLLRRDVPSFAVVEAFVKSIVSNSKIPIRRQRNAKQQKIHFQVSIKTQINPFYHIHVLHQYRQLSIRSLLSNDNPQDENDNMDNEKQELQKRRINKSSSSSSNDVVDDDNKNHPFLDHNDEIFDEHLNDSDSRIDNQANSNYSVSGETMVSYTTTTLANESSHFEVLTNNTEDKHSGTRNDNRTKDNHNTNSINSSNAIVVPSSVELQFIQRVIQLEQLVAAQQVQIRSLMNQVQDLVKTTEAFNSVIALLREASSSMSNSNDSDSIEDSSSKNVSDMSNKGENNSPSKNKNTKVTGMTDSDVDSESIFGTAPATVMDAADAAGAAILAGILGGKQRMLVDVRDAELSFTSTPEHSETLVQFIELAILPVAAGLEGLRSRRNRLKIVFSTVSHLLIYRKSMALSAPDVVALSTLGFDPVELKDNLVVILAPSPDDEEGLLAMNELLSSQSITQPVVVINHHMVPVTGPASTFEVAYHLRLLSVQYMSDDNMLADTYFSNMTNSEVVDMIQGKASYDEETVRDDALILESANISSVSATLLRSDPVNITTPLSNTTTSTTGDVENDVTDSSDTDVNTLESDLLDIEQRHDDEVEAAMKHAQYVGMHHHGSTRAMVIRAYPRAWHIFVDTSPDTDADYEVAAIFADEPNIDQINNAIIECIEGSELEDELVAIQMQQAFEAGQLERVSELLASMGLDDLDDYDDDDDPYNKMFGEDTV